MMKSIQMTFKVITSQKVFLPSKTQVSSSLKKNRQHHKVLLKNL